MQNILQNKSAINALIASVLTASVLLVSFLVFEPKVAYGVAKTFEVTQEITSEISFTQTTLNNVTMTPSILGISGGTAYGTSTFAIRTNNTTGYNMTIAFATGTALQGDGVSSDISNYNPASAGTPDYAFASEVYGQFAYTVNGVTAPGDIDSDFKDDGGTTCGGANTGTTQGTCWYNQADATSPYMIINRLTATAAGGATSTVVFRVGVPSSPSPALVEGFYTATATLTAVTN
jgi:hypothetical protein